jgi:hypothetical protein
LTTQLSASKCPKEIINKTIMIKRLSSKSSLSTTE